VKLTVRAVEAGSNVNFDNSARVSALRGNIRRGDSSVLDSRREDVSIFIKIKDAIYGHKSAPAQAQPAPTPQPAGAATGQAGT
jgi:hypothetical protein